MIHNKRKETAKKSLSKCSSSLLTKEMQIKTPTTLRFFSYLIRVAKMNT